MTAETNPTLRAKRVLVTTDEDAALNKLVTRLAAQMDTTVTLSNLQRACLRLLLHAAPNIYEIARTSELKRPPNSDHAARDEFEQGLAEVLLIAFKKVPHMT